MAGKEKSEGTHTIEIDAAAAANETELVKVVVNNHEVEVSPELAGYLDEQKTYFAGLQTKHQTAMEEAKAVGTGYAERLAKDTAWYSSNPPEAWKGYLPLVQDVNGGYRGDPSLLVPENSDDVLDDLTEPEVKAMTPDPNIKEQADIRKELNDIKLQIARGEGQKSLGVMDTLLRDPNFNLASRPEVLAEVRDYYERTNGQQPTKDAIKAFVQTSHNGAKERNDKAGYIVDKTRFQGAEPSGGMPHEKVEGIRGNIFGNQQDKNAANQDLTAQLGDTF